MPKTMRDLRERAKGCNEGSISELKWVLKMLKERCSHSEMVRRIEARQDFLERLAKGEFGR